MSFVDWAKPTCRIVALIFTFYLIPATAWCQKEKYTNQDASVFETTFLPITERRALSEVIVQLMPGTNQADFAQQQGLSLVFSFQSDPHTFVFTPTNNASVTPWLKSLAGNTQVHSFAQNYQTKYTQHSFTPNDPLYFTSGGYNGQWYLNNSLGRPALNLTTSGAWKSNTPGQGVIIGDVDSGIDPAHPDIAANFNTTHTFDFVVNSATQSFVNGDAHGQATAGIMAAVGGNNTGITGIAPFAQIASMKVFQGNTSASVAGFADAVMFRSSGGNTSVKIKNQSYGNEDPFVDDSIHNAAITTSASAGTIHIISAGNERNTPGQDANKKMAQANPNVITVAAMGSNGVFSNYSSFGANIFVTAPSSNTSSFTAGGFISTTDRVGNIGYNTNGTGSPTGNYADRDYTNTFDGTSASAPMVSGIMALGKQANPGMDVRLAKHILARTSTVVNPTDSTVSSDLGWRANTAGLSFNQNYGFGLVNGDAFVNMVSQFQVTPLVIVNSGTQTVGLQVPDNNNTGITRTFTNTTPGLLEEIVVSLNIAHTFRGNLTAFLTNPAGNYTSRLFVTSAGDNSDGIVWDFVDNAFWGEQALGTWSITVKDLAPADLGTWNSFAISFHLGTIVAIPEPATIAFMGLLAASAMGAYWHHRRRHLRQCHALVEHDDLS